MIAKSLCTSQAHAHKEVVVISLCVELTVLHNLQEDELMQQVPIGYFGKGGQVWPRMMIEPTC